MLFQFRGAIMTNALAHLLMAPPCHTFELAQVFCRPLKSMEFLRPLARQNPWRPTPNKPAHLLSVLGHATGSHRHANGGLTKQARSLGARALATRRSQVGNGKSPARPTRARGTTTMSNVPPQGKSAKARVGCGLLPKRQGSLPTGVPKVACGAAPVKPHAHDQQTVKSKIHGAPQGREWQCKPCTIGDQGSALEPTPSHVARHSRACFGNSIRIQVGDCTRCVFFHNRAAILKVAHIPGQAGATFLEERPAYMGGAWGLGCRICSWYRSNKCGPDINQGPACGANSSKGAAKAKPTCEKSKLAQPGKSPHKHKWQKENAHNPRFNKFAKFEIRGPMHKKTLLQRCRDHAAWKMHKEALRAFFADLEKGPHLPKGHAIGSPHNEEAKKLLAGRVPSATDWRDAFIECEEGLSIRQAFRLACKRKLDHAELAGASRSQIKVRRNQYQIISEVLRCEYRAALQNATSCTLSLDGSAGRKIVRFRADQPVAPWSTDGVIGVVDENLFITEDEFGTDHAERAALKIDELLARFCTPLAAELDQDLKDHILKIVRVISADGCAAERRAMHLTSEMVFPNLISLIRDPAHAIRIAMQALRQDDVFKEMWDELFDNKHSLVPSEGGGRDWKPARIVY